MAWATCLPQLEASLRAVHFETGISELQIPAAAQKIAASPSTLARECSLGSGRPRPVSRLLAAYWNGSKSAKALHVR